LETQAQLALRNKFAFFNLFASMGGQGSIISWANHHPAWAIKDYVHPTEDGSQVIGAMLYKAIQYEYKKLPIQ
jgi:lysophospholipase L1-like esterase